MSSLLGFSFDVAPGIRRAVYQPKDPLSSPVLEGLGDSVSVFAGSISHEKDSAGLRISAITGAISGNQAGWNGVQQWQSQWKARMFIRFRLPNISNVRMFLGLADQTGSTMVSSDNPPGNYVGLQYSTARGDGAWQYVNKDGTTQKLTSSGIVVSNAVRIFSSGFVSGQIEYILSGDSATHNISAVTLNLPSLTANLQAVLGIQTLAGASKTLEIGKAHIECDV